LTRDDTGVERKVSVHPGSARPPGLRTRIRIAGLGLATLCGIRRGGYFLPLRYAADLPAPGMSPPYDAVAKRMAGRNVEFVRLIGDMDRLAPELSAIHPAAPAPDARWRQDWFPRLDAAAAYTIVRSWQPRRIVEVGSGHSTRFLARAIKDGGLGTKLVAIDPEPRAALDPSIEHQRLPVHRTSPAVFDAIAPGDILFVDSSHVLMPGTDVDFLVNRVWPRLPAGVLVHFHDVFLPDDYPRAWAWRGYNEQQAVATLITSGGAEVMFASHYVLTRMATSLVGTVIELLPLLDGAIEASLWLRKTAPG
jgi:Methyltransferase domain